MDPIDLDLPVYSDTRLTGAIKRNAAITDLTTAINQIILSLQPVPNPPNVPPTAVITVTAQNYLDVSVSAANSNDGDGVVTGYQWTWGDGTAPSGGVFASHSYAQAGTYAIGLTVTDDDNAQSGATTKITVQASPVTPPPPTTSTGSGDPGINQTGVAGRQQTGTGITTINSVAGSVISGVGSSAAASLPSGTFVLSNIAEAWGGTVNGSQAIAGAVISTQIRGLYGAGSASTTIRLPDANPPAQESTATTNQHYMVASRVPPSNGIVIDGIRFLGKTTQTANFGGFWTQGATNMTVSNCTFQGIVGNNGAPPGETFAFNVYSQPSGTINFRNVTFEGSNLGAAGLGTNTTSGTINIVNCVASNYKYSAGVATWENRGTINVRNLVMTNNRRNFGAETNAGIINIYDPVWGEPVVGNDFNITWTNNFNGGVINIYFTAAANWTAFINPRTTKKIKVVTNTKMNYGGSAGSAYTGTGDIWANFNVYVAGVKQTATNYVNFTGNHTA